MASYLAINVAHADTLLLGRSDGIINNYNIGQLVRTGVQPVLLYFRINSGAKISLKMLG